MALFLRLAVVVAVLSPTPRAHAEPPAPRPSFGWLEGDWTQTEEEEGRGCIRRTVPHLEATFVATANGIRGLIAEVKGAVVLSILAEYTIALTASGATLQLREGGKHYRLQGSASGEGMRFHRAGKGAGTIVVELRAVDLELRLFHGRSGRFNDPNETHVVRRPPPTGISRGVQRLLRPADSFGP